MRTVARLGANEAHAARPDLVRQLVRLGAAAPLVGAAGQAPVDGLALFDQQRSLTLF